MIKFERYPHINALCEHYIQQIGDTEVSTIFKLGVLNEFDAATLARFIWRMVEQMNMDEDNGIEVLGSTDNTELFTDLNYEICNYMRKVGFYRVWEQISEEEMNP